MQDARWNRERPHRERCSEPGSHDCGSSGARHRHHAPVECHGAPGRSSLVSNPPGRCAAPGDPLTSPQTEEQDLPARNGRSSGHRRQTVREARRCRGACGQRADSPPRGCRVAGLPRVLRGAGRRTLLDFHGPRDGREVLTSLGRTSGRSGALAGTAPLFSRRCAGERASARCGAGAISGAFAGDVRLHFATPGEPRPDGG